MKRLIPVRWKPALTNLTNGIARALDRWRRKLARPDDGDLPIYHSSFLFTEGPLIDVFEDDDEVQVIAELPGLRRRDFEVLLDGDVLVIQGAKESTRSRKRNRCYYSEHEYGAFSRAIRLPCPVEERGIKARFKNGVLKVHLPKPEYARPKAVPIRVAG